jgi:antibiotic biosynthesis monooxygenase (ABM) superfamily enzyme
MLGPVLFIAVIVSAIVFIVKSFKNSPKWGRSLVTLLVLFTLYLGHQWLFGQWLFININVQ